EDSAAVTKLLLSIFEEKGAQPTIRIAAVEGLGQLGEKAEGAAAVLSQGLKDKDVEMRRAVAGGLGKLPEVDKCWPSIKEALNDQDIAVRYQLIRLAGALGRDLKEPIMALADAAVKDANQENRLAAIQELGE